MANRTTGIVASGVIGIGLLAALVALAGGALSKAPADPHAATRPAPATATSPQAPAAAPEAPVAPMSGAGANRPAPKPTAADPAPAPPAAQPAVPAAPAIVVIHARYGSGDQWADVTERVRQLVLDDGLKLPRNLHKTLGVDPVPGFMKYLDLSLTINGAEVYLTVGDNLQIDPLTARSTPPPAPAK